MINSTYKLVNDNTDLNHCIIVSAPHSLCPTGYTDSKNRQHRKCDLVAGKVGLKLSSLLAQIYHPVVFLASDQPREVVDLNRSHSRDTAFRLKLDRCTQSGILALDVHSFPDTYLDVAGDINMFHKDEIPPDIILLEGPGDIFNGKSLTKEIFKYLSKAKVHSKILRGIKVLDIINSAWERGVPGILFEFNEKFNEPKNEPQLDYILTIIIETLRTKLHLA